MTCPVSLYRGPHCQLSKGHEGPHVFPDPATQACGKRHGNAIARCELPAGHDSTERQNRKHNQGRTRPLARTSEKQALLDARWAGVKDGMLFMARKLDPDGPSCEECGVRGNKDTLDLHHLRSRAQGGSYEARNGMLVCRPCHIRLTGDISWTNA